MEANIFELIRSDFIHNGVRSKIHQIQVNKQDIYVIIDTEGKRVKFTEGDFIKMFEVENNG